MMKSVLHLVFIVSGGIVLAFSANMSPGGRAGLLREEQRQAITVVAHGARGTGGPSRTLREDRRPSDAVRKPQVVLSASGRPSPTQRELNAHLSVSASSSPSLIRRDRKVGQHYYDQEIPGGMIDLEQLQADVQMNASKKVHQQYYDEGILGNAIALHETKKGVQVHAFKKGDQRYHIKDIPGRMVEIRDKLLTGSTKTLVIIFGSLGIAALGLCLTCWVKIRQERIQAEAHADLQQGTDQQPRSGRLSGGLSAQRRSWHKHAADPAEAAGPTEGQSRGRSRSSKPLIESSPVAPKEAAREDARR